MQSVRFYTARPKSGLAVIGQIRSSAIMFRYV
jgi:hypothetical protein